MRSLSMALRSLEERARLAQARIEARRDGTPAANPENERHAPEPASAATPTRRGDRLAPIRHGNRDFFVADILDWSLKDDLASMEHPLFALKPGKAGDIRVRSYERNGTTIKVMPGQYGPATIHDKDVWIYCISQLVEALNRGRDDVGPKVRFTAYDFFVTTNRDTSGRAYRRLAGALGRLKGTTIETNIQTAGCRERRGFGLIESWHVIERGPDGRMDAVEVTLPEWLFRSVQACQVLTLSRDYFRLRSPLDRRIYEVTRKHCGSQPKWCVGIKTLYEKSGSTDTLSKFRAAMKDLAASSELPEYRAVFDRAADTMTFYSRAPKGHNAQIHDIMKSSARRDLSCA